MADAEQIRATIQTYAERFSAGDREGWLALWADDATMDDPVGAPIKKGLDEIAAFYDESTSMAESIRLVPAGLMTVVGDEAAWTVEIRPTIGGTEYVMDVIEFMRFTDGPDGTPRIAEMRAFWDPAAMRPA
jgi:steroid delta-isomerase